MAKIETENMSQDQKDQQWFQSEIIEQTKRLGSGSARADGYIRGCIDRALSEHAHACKTDGPKEKR